MNFLELFLDSEINKNIYRLCPLTYTFRQMMTWGLVILVRYMHVSPDDILIWMYFQWIIFKQISFLSNKKKTQKNLSAKNTRFTKLWKSHRQIDHWLLNVQLQTSDAYLGQLKIRIFFHECRIYFFLLNITLLKDVKLTHIYSMT